MSDLTHKQCGPASRLMLAMWLWCALVAAAAANPWIEMGVKDDFAIDQPVVSFELFENDGSGTSLGPEGSGFFDLLNRFILDTGATSMIAMNDALNSIQSNGYVTENTVLEQGVSGFSELDVSAPYVVEITDSDGNIVSLPNTRIMSGQFPELFGVNGVVGMPAMVGHVVSLDETVWEGIATLDDLLDADPLRVSFSNSVPASNGHRYSVPIWAKRFDVIGDPPLPTSAPIPLLEMSVGSGGLDASGTFAVDTGASISFISSELAIQIGLDTNMDGELGSGDERFDGTLPIGGIGGTIEAPLFLIDRLTVPTAEGVDLEWNLNSLTSVLVVDIDPGIDGILGADLLTSGWIDLEAILLGTGESSPGPIGQVHFDFRQFFEDDDAGTAYFDLTPSYDVVLSEPLYGDYNEDGVVDAADYAVWRDAIESSASYLPNDFTPETVDEGDYQVWREHFGETLGGGGTVAGGAGAPVPEPATYALLMAALSAGLLLRGRACVTRHVRYGASTRC